MTSVAVAIPSRRPLLLFGIDVGFERIADYTFHMAVFIAGYVLYFLMDIGRNPNDLEVSCLCHRS